MLGLFSDAQGWRRKVNRLQAVASSGLDVEKSKGILNSFGGMWQRPLKVC